MIPIFDTLRLSQSLEKQHSYTLDEILYGIGRMLEGDRDTESWCSGDCEHIAKSVCALSGGCEVFEIRTDKFRGIHYYAVVDGVAINEGLPYDPEDFEDGETFRHEKVTLTPSLCPWGRELKDWMDKARADKVTVN